MHFSNLAPDHLIAVTVGEPAGIGPDICLDLVNQSWSGNIIIIGDSEVMRERANLLNKNIDFIKWSPQDNVLQRLPKNTLFIYEKKFASEVICGSPNYKNSQTLIDGLAETTKLCLNGQFQAIVTAPINKSLINDGGIDFTGHTEFLANQSNINKPVMLLAAGNFRVALVTTHIPLSMVPSSITKKLLSETITIVNRDLRKYFRINNPRILVCGLNPHAGENGLLGKEDQKIIEPVINEFQLRGYDIKGPLPADTIFLKAKQECDVIIAMYHDQGLPVLKFAGFGEAVNVTLGLPFIRTSVDHGTAFDIAGKGIASSESLISAVELAIKML